MRRAPLSLLLIFALLGLALHFLEHPSVEPCPGHLDGAHICSVVEPPPFCPFCILVAVIVAVVLLAFFLYLLETLAIVRSARLCACPVPLHRNRAPPR
jgi:hypothetical protein